MITRMEIECGVLILEVDGCDVIMDRKEAEQFLEKLPELIAQMPEERVAA